MIVKYNFLLSLLSVSECSLGVLKWVQNTKVVVILFLSFYYTTTVGQLPLISGKARHDAVAKLPPLTCLEQQPEEHAD